MANLTGINVNGVTWDIPQGGGGGSSTFAGLTDTNITSPATGQVPVYNSSTSKWENGRKETSLIATLAAGSETVTFTNSEITSTKTFDVYTENVYIPMVDMSISGTTLTLTFEAQESAVRVKLVIKDE